MRTYDAQPFQHLEICDMDRRTFTLSAVAAMLATGCGGTLGARGFAGIDSRCRQIEADVQGRLGVCVIDTASGRSHGYRADERFPICSTFKWLASALVLHRVDAGMERLDRRIRYGREALVPYAPVTEKHLDDGMTLAELCEATVTLSDNTAGNLVLESFGGPAAFTAYARSLGDRITRLDRNEPTLNDWKPGELRDSTTPAAMAGNLREALLGDALSPSSRKQLTDWMLATKTSGKRLRADLPPGWRLADKTGTGALGSTNDVGVLWPPGAAPLVITVYLTETSASDDRRNDAIADVGRWARRQG